MSLLAMTAPAAVEIKEQNGNVSMNNGTLSARLVKGRNYAFNLTGRDRNGKSLGLVIQSMIWYHGRTGNTEHFYQDQSELKWKPQKYETFSVGPLLAYLVARENEIKTVRIILTGKQNGFPEEAIRERVREMYV